MKLSDALKQLGHPVAYYPTLSRVFGMQESVFLAQFVYWTGKEHSGDGWIYKSAEDIELETGLTYEQQKRVRKVLTGTTAKLRGHHRTARAFIEPIIEERYERMQHKMYFKVNFESMDRAFSENLFSELSQEHSGNPSVPLGLSHTATVGNPRSSTTETTAKTTHKSIAPKGAHKDFVKWWDDMTMKVRGEKVKWSIVDFRNLKIMLATGDREKLEQLALYFLADAKFKDYSPTLRVFLSSGVMDALKNEQNKDGFWHRVDQYANRYMPAIKAAMRLETSIPGVRADFKALTNNLAAKFAMPKEKTNEKVYH